MVACNKFKSKSTGRQYNIKTQITCRSRNLVYLISCAKCGMQYVGETEQALHLRMNGHRSDFRTRKIDKPVAAHFCQEDYSLEELEVKGVEQIHSNREERKLLDFLSKDPSPRMNKDEEIRDAVLARNMIL